MTLLELDPLGLANLFGQPLRKAGGIAALLDMTGFDICVDSTIMRNCDFASSFSDAAPLNVGVSPAKDRTTSLYMQRPYLRTCVS